MEYILSKIEEKKGSDENPTPTFTRAALFIPYLCVLYHRPEVIQA
jgi:hypothetical protein